MKIEPSHLFVKLLILATTLMFILAGALPVNAEVYDVVILNGRVMDPESKLGAVRNIVGKGDGSIF